MVVTGIRFANVLRIIEIGSILILLLGFPAPALAGSIFGDLKEGARSVGRGVEVRIVCGRDGPWTTTTDDYGAYSISVPQAGRCDLFVLYKGRATRAYPIASSDDPARYDFDLVYENSQYVLRRR
jgi:hypothetical protein